MYKVLIRPLKEEDAFISYKWRNDPDIWLFTGNKPNVLVTPKIEIEWIKKAIKEKDSARFAITVDDEYIGNIQITNITSSEQGEYHIFIGEKKYWGKGIGTLATYQIIRYAKEILKLKLLYLYVNPLNIGAIRLYEKCGFKKISDEIKMIYDLSKDKIPMVSVFMMTYNHETYIKQSVDSILNQKTNFDFDIVIGEDCSTDNTRAIIKNIAKSHPGKFKLLLHEKNIGPQANQLAVLSSCTGKYIALCEGDDYWTDPYKLQKQVDFLEANPEYVFTFHDALILNQKTGETRVRIGDRKIDTTVDLKSLITQNNIPTASIVFKNILDNNSLPSWFSKITKGDYGLCVLLAERGLGKYIPEVMSVYRIHEGGVWSGNGFEFTYNADLQFYNYLLDYFKDKDLKKTIRTKIRWTRYNYGISNIRNGRLIKGLYLALGNIKLRGDKRLRTKPRKIASAVKRFLKDKV